MGTPESTPREKDSSSSASPAGGAQAPQLQKVDEEKGDQARMDTMGHAVDSLTAATNQPKRIKLLVCRRCGCAIDTGLCGYGCELDSTQAPERDPAEMEVHVYEFVGIEPDESRSPDGDGHRVTGGAADGDSADSAAIGLRPQQAGEHARQIQSGAGSLPPFSNLTDETSIAGSEPADSQPTDIGGAQAPQAPPPCSICHNLGWIAEHGRTMNCACALGQARDAREAEARAASAKSRTGGAQVPPPRLDELEEAIRVVRRHLWCDIGDHGNVGVSCAEVIISQLNELKAQRPYRVAAPPPPPEDMVCQHGTAMDVHCCGCHSGFLFDVQSCTCLHPSELMMTTKTYSCGCSAFGEGIVPDYCPDHSLRLYRCQICGTRWLLWPDAIHGGGWNLLDSRQRPGACCDNVAVGDLIEHLRDIPLAVAAPPPQSEESHDDQSRVGPSVPCVETAGSTAE